MSFVTEAAKSIKQSIREPFSYQIINYGGRALYIEGFVRVTAIESDKMEFLLRKSLITVTGKDLSLSKLTKDSCMIEGIVEGVYEN